jgi:hypothetical protein
MNIVSPKLQRILEQRGILLIQHQNRDITPYQIYYYHTDLYKKLPNGKFKKEKVDSIGRYQFGYHGEKLYLRMSVILSNFTTYTGRELILSSGSSDDEKSSTLSEDEETKELKKQLPEIVPEYEKIPDPAPPRYNPWDIPMIHPPTHPIEVNPNVLDGAYNIFSQQFNQFYDAYHKHEIDKITFDQSIEKINAEFQKAKQDWIKNNEEEEARILRKFHEKKEKNLLEEEEEEEEEAEEDQ